MVLTDRFLTEVSEIRRVRFNFWHSLYYSLYYLTSYTIHQISVYSKYFSYGYVEETNPRKLIDAIFILATAKLIRYVWYRMASSMIKRTTRPAPSLIKAKRNRLVLFEFPWVKSDKRVCCWNFRRTTKKKKPCVHSVKDMDASFDNNVVIWLYIYT